MFGESKEYDELVKISLTSYVLAEITNRTHTRSENVTIPKNCGDVELRYRGIHPLWVDVMPSFAGCKDGSDSFWPEINCAACVSRGFYFATHWNAVIDPTRQYARCLCDLNFESKYPVVRCHLLIFVLRIFLETESSPPQITSNGVIENVEMPLVSHVRSI